MKAKANAHDAICMHLRACEEALLDPAVRRDGARLRSCWQRIFRSSVLPGRCGRGIRFLNFSRPKIIGSRRWKTSSAIGLRMALRLSHIEPCGPNHNRDKDPLRCAVQFGQRIPGSGGCASIRGRGRRNSGAAGVRARGGGRGRPFCGRSSSSSGGTRLLRSHGQTIGTHPGRPLRHPF